MRANLWYGELRGYQRASITARVNSALQCSPEEILHRQLLGFRRIVLSSAERFPAYALKLREHLGCIPSLHDEFLPADLPLWTKEDQRSLFGSLNPAEFRTCFLHSSGGSTGVPIQFYMTRQSYEWRTAVARRGYSFAGAEPGRRAFFIWSDAATRPPVQARLRARVNQWVENRFFFNCFFFDAERKRLCCQAINQRKPDVLIGYAGKLVELAAFCRDYPGILKWRASSIVTAAEGLQPGQRTLLEDFLGDAVFMSYGSREFMLIGMESQHHCGYHLADDNLLVEVVDAQGQPVAAGQTGQLAVTDLHNTANPFVRYVIGDVGVMAPNGRSCPDGFPFRRLLDIHGRNQEFVVTPQGDQLTLIYFAHNLKEIPWVDAFQVVQKTQRHLVIRVRCSQPLSAGMKHQLASQLRPKLGEARIDVEQVEELSRRANGKIAVLVSELL